MKKFFLLATMFAAVLNLNAQRPMQVWKGNTYSQFITTEVDSVTFLQSPQGTLQECKDIHDTIIVRDTITKVDTVYVKDTVYISYNAFSVSATKMVNFAKGNLQYQASTKTWRFAENQYDYIGSGNANISDTYDGWIDFFGWGTGNNPTDASKDDSDYQTFVDWGTNTIGTDVPDSWRTLSKDEWYYIFFTRANASKLFGFATVNKVVGIIILPDNWTTPAEVTFTPSTEKGLAATDDHYYNSKGDNYTHNTYALEDWKKLENAGAVFLPAAGYRDGNKVDDVLYNARYWSSTKNGVNAAYLLGFSDKSIYPQSSLNSHHGYTVRLVRDAK